MGNTPKNYTSISSCMLCNSKDLTKIFSVRNVFLTGYFPLIDENDPINTPVSITKCSACNNVQAKELVKPELMFKNYWYRSSTTKTMRSHLEDIVKKNYKSDGFLLDIGSNDGTLLEIAENKGMKAYGVEPSDAIKDAPKRFRERTVNSFFGSEECENFFKNKGLKFDLITAISMFYDISDPLKFLNKATDLLKHNGLMLIEVNYAKSFFERKNVDMLGQEHLIYYFIETFSKLTSKAGLFINDAYLTDMNGGNITFLLSKKGHQSERYLYLAQQEKLWLQNFDFQNFEKVVTREFDKFKEKVISISNTSVIKILGASTRGAMIIQMLGLDNNTITSAVDLQKNKVGRRIPGTDIEIEFDADHNEPDYYLVMPYQFKTEIINRYTGFMKRGGGLLFYRPEQELVSYNNKTKEIVHTPII